MQKLDKTTTELATLNEQSVPAFRDMEKDDAISKINTMLDFIPKDLGLREPLTAYDKTSFIHFVFKYYGFLTAKDVKMMFELYVMQKLPEADKHWGKWSAEFYISVIQAYIKAKSRARQKHLANLPTTLLPDAMKQELESGFRRDIIRSYNKLKQGKRLNASDTCYPVQKFWADKGMLGSDPAPSAADKQVALKELLIGVSQGMQVSDAQVISHSKVVAKHRAVVELYDRLIKEGADIEALVRPDMEVSND